MQSSYTAKPSDIKNAWVVINAEDVILGRLASVVANLLRGKHKPTYTPHMDCGENVVVINAEKVKITGNKKNDKKFFWHTGYPGGIKETTPRKTLESAYPERVIERAVERMLPKDSPLARKQFKKLHVYAGSAHPHEAQKPEVLDLAAKNPKNKR